ncbi:chromosome segregation protein SMC [Planococcus lenghuensis]|uniref:Chromosome partition protein Smc n=1 Tax=Planococcus lenghuensis TaxID=2213202 RepID=A0A1Q2L1I9_9BACL|nr:chromosome segregation protein SMC [Planococcus lenghuensis]AQQ53752.1 chromosome segregation protein SMC [Planococcus lenghuensis]
MYLKRLEVIGFKSFADRIGIDFVPGVTAVVGPNGSGKSNVTDAIRWVLGEQSAKSLRGSKMEDVIFAGSDSRKPVNFAEVTLVLDNSDGRLPLDYSEVNVTRRVFRSGDSAYLLNKQVCRLKDITDLFMGSGLGKEAFSVISQGRVDEILNSKPEDRRSIFEEVAGVLKYKQRKKQAEGRLAETEENLNRVADILHELDGRMEPLKAQAAKARDYLSMTAELKDADIALMAYDIKQGQQELEAYRREAADFVQEQEERFRETESLEARGAKIRQEITRLDTEIDHTQQALVEAAAETERWEGRKLLLSEKRQNAERQTEQLEQRRQTEQRENERLNAMQAEQEERYEALRKEQAAEAVAIRQLEEKLKLTPADLEREIEAQKSIYIDLMNEQATIKNELKNIELQELQLTASSERVQRQRQQLESELAVLRSGREQAAAGLNEVRQQLAGQREQYRQAREQALEKQAAATEEQARFSAAAQQEQQVAARLETLKELEADFSGFFQGVREVLIARERNELTGIAGAVAEMAHVDDRYARAIETALGASSQHIITETEGDARKAIEFLRRRRAGRATFLPLSVMKARRLPETSARLVKAHPSFVGIAAELISFESPYRQVMENLLGSVIIASELKGAGDIAKQLGNRYRIVTLDGDIINAGGSMTGGAGRSQVSVFSRKAELDRLTEQLEQLQTEVQNREAAVRVVREQAERAERELASLAAAGETARAKEADQAAELRETEALYRTAKERFDLFQREQDGRMQDAGSLDHRKAAARDRLSELESELAAVSQDIDRMNGFKQESDTARQEVLDSLSVKKSDLAVLKERLGQLAAGKQELIQQLERSDRLLAAYRRELDEVSASETADYSDEEVQAKIACWLGVRDKAQTEVQTAKEQRINRNSNLEKLTAELKAKQHKTQECSEALHALDVKAARVETQLSTLAGQLRDGYQLSLREAERYEMPDSEPVVRKNVRLLKRSIEELGTVNVDSIAEYDQVAERHKFLNDQRSDLNEAKATLHTVIGEMDEEMTVRFDDTFHAIRIQFQHVFRELFGGGSADLILTDPENLLETGVEIIAQPPGKKLQNLSLLSGGERALTAIALLFASLNIRPVPFCILDEVEAALDESNVIRYSQYLKKFSEQTQFIVITHRKGTMEGADVLYGITMQESGVSKLVSVKVEEQV